MSDVSPAQQYRNKLRNSGRKQVLVDLPNELVEAIDSMSAGGRRALVVEELVRSGLALKSHEH